MIKLRLTVTVDYNADPRWYDTDDPEQMSAIDLANFKDDFMHLIDFINTKDTKMTVTTVSRKVKK
jgi:hypothetical protein